MKRLALSTLVVLLAIPALAQDWTSVARKVNKSLVALHTVKGFTYCTGFVVDAKRDFIQTADHCVDEPGQVVYVDGKLAEIVVRDIPNDLAILHVETDKPALKPRTKTINVGMPVLGVGFAYGGNASGPQFRPNWVSNAVYTFYGYGPVLAYSSNFIGGMSGGPVVDQDGRVVGIIQRGAREGETGFGVSVVVMVGEQGEYWAK